MVVDGLKDIVVGRAVVLSRHCGWLCRQTGLMDTVGAAAGRPIVAWFQPAQLTTRLLVVLTHLSTLMDQPLVVTNFSHVWNVPLFKVNVYH